MNSSNLVHVTRLVEKCGAKMLVYGEPGTAKTPMAFSLPNAVACVTETGLSSIRQSNVMAYNCQDYASIDEFFKWFCFSNSKDVYKFNTLIVDSLSRLTDIVIEFYKSRNKNLQKAYGDLADYVLKIVHHLHDMPNMNVVFLAQMFQEQQPIPGAMPVNGSLPTIPYNVPLFAGQKLMEKIPHIMNEIYYVKKLHRPDGIYGPAIITNDTNGEAMARSRCGKLNTLEPPDLNYIFSKINS